MSRRIDARLAALEQQRPKKAPHDPEALLSRIGAVLAEREAYQALSADQKLAQLRAKLAQVGEWTEPRGLGNGRLMHDTHRRLLELDEMELEGADPELIELERHLANATFRCAGNAQRFEADMRGFNMRKRVEAEERGRH